MPARRRGPTRRPCRTRGSGLVRRPGVDRCDGGEQPPWAPIPSEPRGLAKDEASAIPDSAFPAPPLRRRRGGHRDSGRVRRWRQEPDRASGVRPPRHTGRPPRGTPRYPVGRPGNPRRSRTANCRGPRLPRRPVAEQDHCPSASRHARHVPSWDSLAEDVWPGGPRGAALHPPVPPPADRNPGGLAARGSTAGAPALGARPASRPVPAAGLVPPQPDSPERARPAEERPGHKRNPDAGVTPSARPSPSHHRPPTAPAAPGPVPGSPRPVRPSRHRSQPTRQHRSQPIGTDRRRGQPAHRRGSRTAARRGNPPTDASASEPAVPLPRRLSTPPLRPPRPLRQPARHGFQPLPQRRPATVPTGPQARYRARSGRDLAAQRRTGTVPLGQQAGHRRPGQARLRPATDAPATDARGARPVARPPTPG